MSSAIEMYKLLISFTMRISHQSTVKLPFAQHLHVLVPIFDILCIFPLNPPFHLFAWQAGAPHLSMKGPAAAQGQNDAQASVYIALTPQSCPVSII